MAAFTSSQDGVWDDGGTWGNNSPGVEGTDFPGNADTASIGDTVTIDDTRPTSGSISTITITSGGILTFLASANTKINIIGNTTINSGGELRMGTTGTPIESGKTCEWALDATSADLEIQVDNGGVLNMQGNAKFGTPSDYRTTSTDTITAVSDRTVDTAISDLAASGWAAGDPIFITGTVDENDGYELATILSVSTSVITIDADWAETHLSGAHIVNLRRNVRFYPSAGTNDVWIDNNSTTAGDVDIDWAEFRECNPAINNAGVIDMNSSNSAGDIDNTSFYNCGGASGNRVALYIAAIDKTFTNLAVVGETGSDLLATEIGSTGNLLFDNSIFIGGTNTPALIVIQRGNDVTFKNSVLGQRAAGSGQAPIISIEGGMVTLEDSIVFGGATTSGAGEGVRVRGILIARNTHFGSDGTNNMSNGNADITLIAGGQAYCHNCKFDTPGPLDVASGAGTNQAIRSTRHDRTTDRHKYEKRFGIISDHVTGGQAANWSNGGAGIATLLAPNSTTAGELLEWEVYIPVTASTSFTLKAFVRKTAGAPTLTCTIYDNDKDTVKLLDAESVTLTTSWVQYSATSKTPALTGFCRVVFSALDNASAGDVGIDDVTVE